MVYPSTRNGLPSGGSNEWFEILNSGPTSVNLSTIRYDTDGNASNGTLLGGTLASGRYAIIGNRTLTQWQAAFGTLPGTAIYFQATAWKILYNDQYAYPSESLDLYSTTTNSEIFSIRYPNPKIGRSFQYVGASTAGISPFLLDSTHWVVSSSTPSGSLDAHSAGSSSKLRAAPEPAAVFLTALSCLGLIVAVRQQRTTVLAG